MAMRMAEVSAVLMRGLAAHLAGNGCRQVGHVFLPCAAHLLKQPRQKLCWQGACPAPAHKIDTFYLYVWTVRGRSVSARLWPSWYAR